MSTQAELLELTDQEYRAIEAVSQSALKKFLRDPWQHYCEDVARTHVPPPPTAAMRYGSEVERYLLYGEAPKLIFIPPEVLNQDGHRKGTAWTQFAQAAQQAHPDHELVKLDEYQKRMAPLETTREQALAHPLARELLWKKGGERHRCIVWTDPVTGLLCKCQLDVLHWDQRLVVDLKTTQDVRPAAFGRQTLSLGYHLQDGWYRRAAAALEPEAHWRFDFVVCKSKPSYDVEVYRLKPAWHELADAALSQAMAALLEARTTGRWRSQTHGTRQLIEPPNWAWASLELELESE